MCRPPLLISSLSTDRLRDRIKPPCDSTRAGLPDDNPPDDAAERDPARKGVEAAEREQQPAQRASYRRADALHRAVQRHRRGPPSGGLCRQERRLRNVADSVDNERQGQQRDRGRPGQQQERGRQAAEQRSYQRQQAAWNCSPYPATTHEAPNDLAYADG